MTERELQNAVLELAGYLGWKCYHTFDSRRSQAGFPDLVLVKPGRLIFAELKSARGKLTNAQADWGAALLLALQDWYEWRPIDWTSGAIEAVLKGEK